MAFNDITKIFPFNNLHACAPPLVNSFMTVNSIKFKGIIEEINIIKIINNL